MKGSKKTFLIVALSVILIVSLCYLSRQEVREGMENNEKKNREPFRGREALAAGCYSGDTYLGTGTGILDCRKNYPDEKGVTYRRS